MDKVLLDTDIFSEILKGLDQNVVAQATAYLISLPAYSKLGISPKIGQLALASGSHQYNTLKK
jgi:hypothetical protein